MYMNCYEVCVNFIEFILRIWNNDIIYMFIKKVLYNLLFVYILF